MGGEVRAGRQQEGWGSGGASGVHVGKARPKA
jgi:hypothetical protein